MKQFTIVFIFLIASLIVKAADPGTPVAGKLFFSNQPFSSSAAGKKNFSSQEYIYGRFELNEATVAEAFKLKEAKDRRTFLCFAITILQNGEEVDSDEKTYILLKNEDNSATAINFDVMPEPSKATTVFSLLDDFSAGYGFTPLNGMIINKRLDAGKYTVRIRFFMRAEDGWGKELDREKWPTLEDEFEFVFRDQDIARVQKDYDDVREVIKENAFRYDKMPAIFSNSATITDPKVTNAKILAIIKRELPNRTILKLAIEKTGTLWSIAKDDYNLPKYRYFYPAVYVAYKMDGKCYIGTVTLRETYTGGGSYGPLEVGFTSASEQQDKGIDCAKVK